MIEPNEALTTADVTELTGVSAPTLTRWRAMGIVRSSVETPDRQGKRALWSPEDVEVIRELDALVKAAKELTQTEKIGRAYVAARTAVEGQVCVVAGDRLRIVDGLLAIGRLAEKIRGPLLIVPRRISPVPGEGISPAKKVDMAYEAG